ncbi:MAG: recombinase family protein [Candidatus Omnitrophota bacterium]|nr:recombinase family protein [Candidatus Omnitrophota bacterium]
MPKQKSQQKKTITRCAMYTRVSTEEQAKKSKKEANPLNSQKEVCRHFIALKKEENWAEAKVYEDAGYSGKDIKRPALQELLQDIELGFIDAVVFYKYDRLSRSPKDFYHLVEVFGKHNTIFASATQPLDTSTSAGKLMLNMLLSFAEFERELISERTQTTLSQRAKDGKWHGGWIPFGYDYDYENKMLVINKKESEGVKLTFKRFLEGKRLSEIKEELNALGFRNKIRTIKTRKGIEKTIGGNKQDEDDVIRILNKTVYAGLISHEDKDYKAKHKAIITEKMFRDVEKIRNKKKEKKEISPFLIKKDERVHLLKGILKCGDCGSTMTPYPSGKKQKDGTPYLYYTCVIVSKEPKDSECKVRYLPAREFENIIKKTISDISKNKKLLDECITTANKDSSSGLAPLLKKQKKHQKEINELSKHIKNLVEGMKRGIMSRDVQEEHNRLVEERDRLQLTKDKLSVEVEMKQNKLLNIDVIQKGLRNFDKVIDALPLEDQKELMQLLIKEITVYPFDPEKEQISENQKDTFKIKIRTKWFKIKMSLYAIPDISIGYKNSSDSSYSSKDGCPVWTRTRNT